MFWVSEFRPIFAWIFVIWEVLQVTATKKSHVKTETWNPENQPRMGWCSTMGIKAKQMEQMGAKSCHWLVMACRLSWLVHPRVIFDHKHMRPVHVTSSRQIYISIVCFRCFSKRKCWCFLRCSSGCGFPDACICTDLLCADLFLVLEPFHMISCWLCSPVLGYDLEYCSNSSVHFR